MQTLVCSLGLTYKYDGDVGIKKLCNYSKDIMADRLVDVLYVAERNL